MIGPHAALVYTMVLLSMADREMTDAEIRTMQEVIGFLPSFREFDLDTLPEIANGCVDLLRKTDGLDVAIEQIKAALPKRLRETAYALGCDVVASDGEATQEELQLLEMLRDAFELDPLVTAAIERGTRARFTAL